MTQDEFKDQMARLGRVYGEKNFPPERLNVLWGMFKFEKAENLASAVSSVIVNSYVAPPANKIREHLSELGERDNQKHRKEMRYDCSWCGTSGFVLTMHRETLERSLMKCKCDLAFRFARARIEIYDPNKMPDIVCEYWSFEASEKGPHNIPHSESEELSKALSEKYYPSIKEALDKFCNKTALPYDPNERIEDTGIDWKMIGLLHEEHVQILEEEKIRKRTGR